MNAYTEHYFPLECNLDVVTELVRRLGADEDLAFEKALSLDKPELFPRPALAVVLALPTAPAHGERKAVAEATRGEYTGGDEKAVLWFKQRINDACGWYAVLRALCSSAHDFLEPGSFLQTFLPDCIAYRSRERALMPEQHPEIERTYAAVAAVPCSSENEVDYHCICFVRSDQDECLYELDGDSNGPVCLGPVNVGEDGDILRPETIARIRKYIDVEKGGNTGCSLMALVDHGMILASLEAL